MLICHIFVASNILCCSKGKVMYAMNRTLKSPTNLKLSPSTLIPDVDLCIYFYWTSYKSGPDLI